MPLVQTDYGLIYNTDGTLYATLRPGEGRFGGAVAVEEATENLVTNPFFQEGKSGWETAFQSGLNFWDVTEEVSWQGGKSLVFEGDGNHTWRGIGQTIGPFAAGESITIQYVHRATGHLAYPLTVNLREISAQVDSTSLHTRSIGEWMLSSRTFTFLENTGQFQFELRTSSGNAPGTRIYLGGVQVEKKPFATSFVDGTRAAGVLRYSAAGIINPDAGTIAFWYRPEFDLSLIQDQSTSPKLIQVGNYHRNGSFTLWHYSNPGQLSLYVRGQDATGWTAFGHVSPSNTGFARSKWSYVAVTWDGLNWAVYVDGRQVLSITSSQPLGRIDGDIWEFAQRSPKYSQLFDELLILPYAADEQEIQSWYQNGITHVRKPGYYASFDDSLALQYWSEVTYDYRVQNNRVIFERPPKDEDNILVFYETAVPNEDKAGS